MTQSEKKYILERINQISNIKLMFIDKFCTEEEIKHDAEKRLKFFNEGRYKLKSKNPFLSNYMQLNDSFIFEGEKEAYFDNDTSIILRSKVIKKANKLRDKVMFGDCKCILKLIEEFETYEPTTKKGN